jgi:surfeit locus 1 family protein
MAETAPPKRIPWLATLLVLAAAAGMVQLGVWQLHRKAWKEGLIARFAAASADPSVVPWPARPEAVPGALYHHASLQCAHPIDASAVGGTSASGENGWAHAMLCDVPGGSPARVVIGWSADPALHPWAGGTVRGVIAPFGHDGAKLVADPPVAGLTALAKPDPRDVPNNHFAYALQWFAFAVIAVVVYVLALAKQLREG